MDVQRWMMYCTAPHFLTLLQFALRRHRAFLDWLRQYLMGNEQRLKTALHHSIRLSVPVDKPDGNQLRSLLDNASALYSSLSSLGTGSDIAQALLIFIVIGKCDQQTRNKWNVTLPNWAHCTTILERHCQFLQSSRIASYRMADSSKQKHVYKPSKGLSFVITNPTCIVCSSSDHKIVQCSQFQDMSPKLSSTES
ncbi:uncharacterized protein [Drosophila virilis]|uniref:uncharacterized protein n=1 Tax=Drosophila virilis TaxID=7244 RepID=UPI0038B3973C